jgi:hypothetical protein
MNAEWLPIETAPKDGTSVDLWIVDGYRLADVRFTVPVESLGESPCWCEYTTDFHGYGDWGIYPIGREIVPSHWMPLPEPPK